MPSYTDKEIIARDVTTALLHGCHQLDFSGDHASGGPRTPLPIQINYTLPSGLRKAAKGFLDAEGNIHARCYVTEVGTWRWEAKTALGKGIASNTFEAQDSTLPGKLAISRQDHRQFRYANGDPFFHLGDVQLSLFSPDQANWQACIDQSAQAGFTKIRSWLPTEATDASVFYDAMRKELNLAFWDEVEKRLVYALGRHPHVQFQLNIFANDRSELERYEEGDPLTHLCVLYLFERFSSLPNVHWSLANDIDPTQDNAVILQALSRLGKASQEQAVWPALATCGQPRYSTFLFDREPWCGMTSLASLGQVTGAIAQEQRPLTNKPLVVDEDRAEFENAPLVPRYYFRRLFWSLLLSGAHPTYAGLNTRPRAKGHQAGIHGYYDACHSSRLGFGAHDLLHITHFFRTLDLTLEGWVPDDSIGGNNPLLVKSMRSQHGDKCILYVANPDLHEAHTGRNGKGFYTDQNASASDIFTTFNLELPFSTGTARWYSPTTGEWKGEVEISKSSTIFLTPEPGDWVLYASRS